MDGAMELTYTSYLKLDRLLDLEAPAKEWRGVVLVELFLGHGKALAIGEPDSCPV